MKEIKFTVPGVPKGKPRHRTIQDKGGNLRTYPDPKGKKYELAVQTAYLEACTGQKKDNHDGPVYLIIRAYFPIPASWPKWKKELAQDEHLCYISKPDWDNVGKIVSDALNSFCWHDDAQIADAILVKRYSATPRVEVSIGLYPKLEKPK